jgi:hypothetical protein
MIRGMTGSAIPYVVVGVLGVGWIVGEDWLRRRTGQPWWPVHQLGWGVFSAVLAVLVAYEGHPLIALMPAALAVLQFASARRNWVKRPRDLMERNAFEIENGGAAGRRRASGTGVRGWLFTGAVVAVWTLLEGWGFSSVSAGVVAAVTGLAIFLPWRRSSIPDEPLAGGDFDRPPPRYDQASRVPSGWEEGRVDDMPTGGHGWEFTLTGRPARLLGRVLDRIAGSSGASDE